MQHTAHESRHLGASTLLCVSCLVLLLTSYMAIGFGMAQVLRAEIPIAVPHLVRF